VADAAWSILIVEDDPSVVKFMSRAFESVQTPKFAIEHAGSLKAGLELAKSNRHDLVLLDLGLPDSSGLNSLERLLKAAPEAPVVVMTGAGDDATAAKAVEMGAEDFLQKGQVDFKRIFRTVLFAIQRQRKRAAGGAVPDSLKQAVDVIGTAVSLYEKGVLSAEDALTAVKNAQRELGKLGQPG
jgi:DNA-binding NtrC family response regulator